VKVSKAEADPTGMRMAVPGGAVGDAVVCLLPVGVAAGHARRAFAATVRLQTARVMAAFHARSAEQPQASLRTDE